MVLGDLIQAAPKGEIDNTDFWLTDEGVPTEKEEDGKIAIKVVDLSVLVPKYLYFVLSYLKTQGLWSEREVSADAVLAIPIDLRT